MVFVPGSIVPRLSDDYSFLVSPSGKMILGENHHAHAATPNVTDTSGGLSFM